MLVVTMVCGILYVRRAPKHYFAHSPESFCGFVLRVYLGNSHWKMAGIFDEFFLVSHETKLRSQEKGFLEGGFCKMYASLGCGALSARCTAGATILGYFLSPWPWHWTLKTPFLLAPEKHENSSKNSGKLGERQKGSLLKGSFDKACALTCRFLCRSLSHSPTSPTPFPFSLISTGKPTTHLNPTPNPSPRDTSRNSHPFAKTTPGKNYPLVSARKIGSKIRGKIRDENSKNSGTFLLQLLRPELWTRVPATEPRRLKIPQSGAKGVLANCRKGLPRVSCTSAALFCTSATLSCTSLTGFWPTYTETPFAPSPNHVGEFWDIWALWQALGVARPAPK